MATQPPPETPAPTQPGQPVQPPPEVAPPTPNIDQPDPGTVPDGAPDSAPGQPVG